MAVPRGRSAQCVAGTPPVPTVYTIQRCKPCSCTLCYTVLPPSPVEHYEFVWRALEVALAGPNATNYGLVVEYVGRAQGATQGLLPQNLHGTHTLSAESSGRRYVAAALLGDGLAAWHLATSAEAADRGLVMC